MRDPHAGTTILDVCWQSHFWNDMQVNYVVSLSGSQDQFDKEASWDFTLQGHRYSHKVG